jgi:hypothetical protein
MICVIIRNLRSDCRDITEAPAIGQHPMHDDGDFARRVHYNVTYFSHMLDLLAGLFRLPSMAIWGGVSRAVGPRVRLAAH